MQGSVWTGKRVCWTVGWQSSDAHSDKISYCMPELQQKPKIGWKPVWLNLRTLINWLSQLTTSYSGQRGECKELNTHLSCNHFLSYVTISCYATNKKFRFRFRSTVRTVLFRFYGILRFCGSTIADSASIGFRTQLVIFDTTYLRLEASYRHGIKSNI